MLAIAVALKYLAGVFDGYGMPVALAGWLLAMAAFLAAGRYSIDELTTLWRTIMPGTRASDVEAFAGTSNAA